jgi:ABC-2 type transport system permease protein
LLRAYVLIALYGARTSVAGYSLPAAITYTALSQALIAYIAIWSWWDMIRTFRTGEVATDLSRPCDYFWYWFAQDAGRAVANLLLRGLPMIVLYALFYRIVVPVAPLQVLALLVSLVLALFVSFSWRFLVSLSGFWTTDATGVGRMAWMAATFLSGQMMPLAMFPTWAAGVLRATPWAAMMNTPIEVYLGIVRGPALVGALALQAAWGLALMALGRYVLRAGVHHLVVQGG